MMDQHSELRELIEKNLESALETQVAAHEVLAQISQIVGRGTSRTGVRASVDHRGLVTDVALSERCVGLGLDEMRAEVLESVEAARSDVQLQAAPLQAQLQSDPRPLEQQTDVLDALDRLVRGSTDHPGAGRPAAPSSPPPTDPTTGDRP
ncbi:hypothetical protein [Sanguibacter sp. 25GB23B1]|uniref:hypothetical protein n=1 Tax=unclassified Sanguibacter TaxID=2645534 RepID=UPI0032AF3981